MVWFTYMTVSENWALFQEFWPVSVTMALGSVIAGATPQGGATVAFPVFTKVLNIASSDARTFGLMIQAVGMTMAAVFIFVRRIKVLPHVIGWVSVGGAVGVIAGAFIGQMPGPYPKILFTFATTAFGVALILSRWILKSPPRDDIKDWGNGHRLIFALTGIFGGFFAANTGAGTDMFAFILLTLAFGVNEKISTPTTVIIMGINSVVGFALYAAMPGPIGAAWNYWLVAVPIVILGAPLGALITSRIKRDYLIGFILFLTGVELTTTLWLVPFNQTMTLVAVLTIIVCAFSFWAMLTYRNRKQIA